MYDIIVIGAGPAGLTAALYICRANKKVLVLEKGTFGGQITYSPHLENIPGFPHLSGNEYAEKLLEQVVAQGADIEYGEALSVKENGNTKTVLTDRGEYTALAVIVATGARHRTLQVPNEEKFIGNGISFCAVCDGAFYRDKVVGVVGGGNTALQEAVLLADTAKQVYVFQLLDHLTGEQKLKDRIQTLGNVSVKTNVTVTSILGDRVLEGIRYRHTKTGEEDTISLDGLFIAIGFIPQNEPFENILELDRDGYAEAGENCAAKTPGVFVAGDCRTKIIRQVTTAAADGTVAALNACNYVDTVSAFSKK